MSIISDLNLDAMDQDDLLELTLNMQLLTAYASGKWLAMQARRSGAVNAALKYEGMIDAIYKQLPEQWRW